MTRGQPVGGLLFALSCLACAGEQSGVEREPGGASAVFHEGGASGGPATVNACILRVAANNGNEDNTGESWRASLKTIQQALDVSTSTLDASKCSTVEIWVAAGTYVPTLMADPDDPRTATFQLLPNVSLFGGFAGWETSRIERNTKTNVTLLSGDLGTPGEVADNSYHVLIGATGATLDGFTVTGGNANGSSVNPFRDADGGALLNVGTSPTITDCIFVDNYASSGGALFNQGASPTVTDCIFIDNQASTGGAMLNDRSSPFVAGCHFQRNSAARGGAIYNSSYKAPGSPTIRDCTFNGNSASDGGAIANVWVQPLIVNSTFSANIAATGGAVSNLVAWSQISNCLFVGNVADKGGALFNENNSTPTVNGCTFAANRASQGVAIYNSHVTRPTVINSILWDVLESDTDATEIFSDETAGSPLVSYCIVQGGYAESTQILTDDPRFVDPAGGDYTLREDSPAIDSANGCLEGVSLTDLASLPRWDIARAPNVLTHAPADLGAYEYQGDSESDTVLTTFDCE